MSATKTISFYGEEADAIIATLSKKDMEIKSLRQQLASRDAEVTRLQAALDDWQIASGPDGWITKLRNAEIAELKVVSDHNLSIYHKAIRAERDQLREQVKMLRDLLLRYRTEVRPGFQPHMICLEVDAALAATEEPK